MHKGHEAVVKRNALSLTSPKHMPDSSHCIWAPHAKSQLNGEPKMLNSQIWWLKPAIKPPDPKVAEILPFLNVKHGMYVTESLRSGTCMMKVGYSERR